MDVSIIITSYNYDDFIEESIESCLCQETDCKYEVIVVDDGSIDDTKNILKKYLKFCRIIHIQNSGVEAASNIGVKNSNSKYFIRLDADDSIKRNLVDVLLKNIEDTKLAFAYPNYDSINEYGEIINSINLPKYSKEEIFKRGDFLASGTIFNKQIFDKVGGYNEKYKNCGLENYELILKLIKCGYKGHLVKQNLFNYRIHKTNMSLERRESLIKYGKNLFNKNCYGEFTSNKFHPYGLKI